MACMGNIRIKNERNVETNGRFSRFTLVYLTIIWRFNSLFRSRFSLLHLSLGPEHAVRRKWDTDPVINREKRYCLYLLSPVNRKKIKLGTFTRWEWIISCKSVRQLSLTLLNLKFHQRNIIETLNLKGQVRKKLFWIWYDTICRTISCTTAVGDF